ncbi:MAG: ribosome maturation factor RimM [Imperialibacter sp.]
MDIDSCYQIGYVIKRHGLKGDVKVHLDSPLPKKLESIFVEIDNRLVPFFIEAISVLEDLAIIKLEEVDNPDQASKLNKCKVFISNTYKPKSNGDEFETSDLVGFSVYSNSENLGTISSINNHALNPLLVVVNNQKEMLIPISDYFIKGIDHTLKRVKVELPDGFVEI